MDRLSEARRLLVDQGSCGVRQWQTIGPVVEADAEPSAFGSADLVGRRCLVQQQSYPPARADSTQSVLRAASPSKRFFLGVADAAFRAVGTKFVTRYYDGADSFSWNERSQKWQRDGGGSGQIRRNMDPTMVLDLLDGIADVSCSQMQRRSDTQQVGGTQCDGRLNLLSLVPRLDRMFADQVKHEPNRDWAAAAPVRGWIDDAGRLVRVSWAPLPNASSDEPRWLTTDFFEFGHQFPPAEFSSI